MSIWSKRWVRYSILGFAGFLALLTLVIVGGLSFVMSESGARFAQSKLDGRALGGAGTLELEGLHGNLLSRLTADRITLTDQNGVWLEIEDVTLGWRPVRMIRKRLIIEKLDAESVTLYRLPEAQAKEEKSGGGALPVAIRLGELDIGQLDIREEAFGQAAILTASGSAQYRPGGQTRVALNARETTGGQDRLALDMTHMPGKGVKLDLDVNSAADGLITELLGAPEGEASSLRAALSGDEQAGAGNLSLAFNDRPIANAQIDWTQTDLAIDGHIDMAGWPLLSPVSSKAGAEADFTATIGDFKSETRSVQISADAPLLSVEAAGSDLSQGVQLDLTARQLAEWTGGSVKASELNWRGEIRHADAEWTGQGDATLTDLGAFRLQADRVQGSLGFSYGDGAAAFNGDLALTGAGSSMAALNDQIGDRIDLGFTGQYRLESGDLSFNRLTVKGEAVNLQANVAYGVKSGVVKVDGQAQDVSLGRLSEQFSGVAGARVQVRRSGPDTAYDVRLDGEVTGFDAQQQMLADLVGQNPKFEAVLSAGANGMLNIETATIQSEKSVFGAKGGLDPDAGYDLDLEGRVNGPVTVSSAELQGTILARGRLTGPTGDPSLDITLFADSMTAGGIEFQHPKAQASMASLTGDLQADISAEAGTEYGPATAAFMLSRNESGLKLGDLNVKLADATAAGDLALGDGGASGTVNLTKTGEGPSPYPGKVDGTLTLSTRNDRQYVALSLTGENLLFPEQEIRLTSISADTEGYLDNLDFTVTGEGSLRGLPSTLDAQGHLADTETGRAISVDFTGEYGRLELAAREPLTYSFGGDESQMRAKLSIDEGALDIEMDNGPDARRLLIDLRDIPLAILEAVRAGSRLEGALNARAEMINRNGDLSGDIAATLADAHVADDDLEPVNISLKGDIRQDSIAFTLEGQDGADMRASGNATVAIQPAEGFVPLALNPDGPLDGEASIQGAIDSLASLATGPEQRLGGNIDARLTLGGTMNNQRFNGSVDLGEGRFDDGVSGIALRDLAARAEFANDRVAVTELEGRDTENGTLNGRGQARSVDGGWAGEIKVDFNSLQVANRRDANVDASGEISVNLDPDTPAIDGDININRGEFRPPNTGAPGVTTIEVIEINRPGQEDEDEETVSGRGRTPFALDISLDAPRRLFVRTNTVNVEMGLDARIGGTSASPKIFGTASVIRGEADLASERFTFNEGEIVFDGAPLKAELDLTATHDAAELTAIVHVTGTPQEPRIELTSQPPLPQDEILSQVLFGRSVSQLSGLEAAQMAAALSSLAGGGGFDALGQLRSGLGLDRLSVSNGESGTIVTGGQYLTDDVYLELSSGGADGPAAQIEWQALKNFAIISRFGSARNTSVSVRWRKDY